MPFLDLESTLQSRRLRPNVAAERMLAAAQTALTWTGDRFRVRLCTWGERVVRGASIRRPAARDESLMDRTVVMAASSGGPINTG